MTRPAFAELAEYLDLLLEAICVVEPNHRISYVSRGAERVFWVSARRDGRTDDL